MRIQTRSGPIGYIDAGRGPTVLFLHAFPLNRTMWQDQLEVFSTRCRVLAPDFRGFGESTPPISPWTIEDACQDLDQFLTELNIEECTVVGLSMGGYVGLPFTSRFPQRVSRLVLANTRARADNETERNGRTDMIEAIREGGTHVLVERMLSRLLQPNPAPEVSQSVQAMIEQTEIGAAIHALTAMRNRTDASSALERLTCPVLVIAGEHDIITRVTECRAMAKSALNGKYVEIPGAGHLSNLENSPAFNEALSNFLLS